MPTLDTSPDGHAHQHQHTPVEPPAASTPSPAPRHTHQPQMPGGRTPGSPLRGPPTSPQRHHRHHRPRRGLHHSSILHPLQMQGLRRSGGIPFLQLPKWPQCRVFGQYLTQTAQAAGHSLLGSQPTKAAYRDFKKQHPCPVRATPPYTPTGWKHEPAPPVTGPVLPLTLLLAPNGAKPTQTTVIHHGAKWRIPNNHKTAQDLPKVPHDSQSMPRTCPACDLNAPTRPWPVLHLIAHHHTHRTAHLPPQAYTWAAPWFHPTDTIPTVAWKPDHKPQWLFPTTPTWPCPDPAGNAIRYSVYEPGRTGEHEHPYYPVQHSCHTPEHRTQTSRAATLTQTRPTSSTTATPTSHKDNQSTDS